MKSFIPLLLLLLSGFQTAPEASAASRPNIVLIMADDLGAEGLGCYGSTIFTTPNLDRMASEGLRFRNAYTIPLCTPTRVMLMSGLYPNRTGFQNLISKDKGVRMPADIRTFGHDFRDAGYQTAIAGKWQLGKFDEYPGQPIEHGFDHYCLWTWYHGGKKTSRYYAPQICRDGTIFDGTSKEYGPDFFSDYVLNFIDENRAKPFFIYYPMALVHSPFVIPPDLEALARSNYPDDLDKATATFGTMLTYADSLVGRILDRLREHHLDKNTLVLFTGDNGTDKNITSRLADGLRIPGGKGSMTEAGSRVPLLAWWPETIAPGTRDAFFTLADMAPTLAQVARIPLARTLDGMDLSHTFWNKPGTDRQHVLINLGRGYFVRDESFRLHQDGRFFHIPVTSDATRYAETEVVPAEHAQRRLQLQQALDSFLAIQPDYSSRPSKDSQKPKRKKKA